MDALLAGDGAIERDIEAAIIEPALLQNLAGSFVTSINLANADRTRAVAGGDCPDQVFPFPTGELHVSAKCLLGDVTWTNGFNLLMRQSVLDNAIILNPGIGAGLGQPCDETKIFQGENALTQSQTLDGSPKCNEVLRAINGVGGPTFTVSVGAGVNVSAVPELHKVVIAVNMQGLAVCATHVSESC
jgi:hypothetical protein